MNLLRQLREANPGKVRLPLSAGVVLANARKRRLWKRATRLDRAREAWKEAVGTEVAACGVVLSLRAGTLQVRVESQALAHELGVFRAAELVEKINVLLDGKDRIAKLRVHGGLVRSQASRARPKERR